MIRFSRLLILGLVVLAGSATMVLAIQLGSAQPNRDFQVAGEPWPPFVMEYKETAKGFGPNGSVGEQVTRLEYTDRRHFKLTILAHPGGEGFVGRSWTFDGDAVIIFRPPNSVVQGSSPGPEGGAVPDDWIVPGAAPVLAARPGARIIANGDGTATVIYEAVGKGQSERTEVRLRQVDGIPLSMIQVENGQVVRRAEATRLEIGKR